MIWGVQLPTEIRTSFSNTPNRGRADTSEIAEVNLEDHLGVWFVVALEVQEVSGRSFVRLEWISTNIELPTQCHLLW